MYFSALWMFTFTVIGSTGPTLLNLFPRIVITLNHWTWLRNDTYGLSGSACDWLVVLEIECYAWLSNLDIFPSSNLPSVLWFFYTPLIDCVLFEKCLITFFLVQSETVWVHEFPYFWKIRLFRGNSDHSLKCAINTCNVTHYLN